MRSFQGAAALVLAATSVVVQGQECPPGYEKSKKIDWVSCEIKDSPLECATLKVPRDWTNPSSGTLNLRLVRQPAAKGTVNPQSIIMNPGGPGASGINMVLGDYIKGGKKYQGIAGTNFNIIGFDPRGVGYSELYKCPVIKNVQQGRDEYLAQGGIATAFNYMTKQAAECEKPEYQSDLVGTAFTARDINAITEALGEDGMIRYWGYSYGTLLGATVAAMYPKKIERLVLDGNINPTDYYFGLGDEMCADFDRGVENFFTQCTAAQDKCAVYEQGKDAKAIQKKFDDFLKNDISIEQSWTVRSAFQDALYFNDENDFINFAKKLANWYKAPNTVTKRSTPLRRDLDWTPKYEENENEPPMGLDAIQCGDVVDRPVGSEENFARWLDLYTKTSKNKSVYSGDIAIRGLFQCSTWKVNAKGKFTGQFKDIETKRPILFVNTRFDPVTPLVSATNSAAGFKDAKVLYSTGVGHCTTNNPSSELDEAIGEYFSKGTFPDVKEFKPDVDNVFTKKAKRSVEGPIPIANVKRPRVFDTILKRADPTGIPDGCTKIAASASASASASSAVISQTSSVPSMSITASAISSQASASGSGSVLSSSAAPSSASPSAQASLSSGSSIPISSAASSSPIGSVSSAPSSAASLEPSLSQSSIVASMSPGPSSAASLEPSLSQSASVASVSSGIASISVSSQMSSGSSPSTLASDSAPSSAPGVSTLSPGSTSPSSVKVYGAGNISTSPSRPTTTPYGQGYSVVYTPSSRPGYQASSANQVYGDVYPTTSPCFTQAWASQSGYVPMTQTYTTTAVQTITQCRRNEYCPLNQATPTVVITKTQTGTTVVAVPTTTVYVTKVVDVCSTGLKTSTVTITRTCKSGCTTRPTGLPKGWTTTVKYCDACVTPSTVTVTYCASCSGKQYGTPTPQKPASTPAVPTKPASVPGYGSQPISKPTGGASSVPGNGPVTSSKPAVPVYSKPSVPVGSNSTVPKNTPVVGTPVKVSTLQTNPASTGSYQCSGPNCPTVTKSVLQFTGAAAHEHGNQAFVLPALFAGLAFFL